MWQRARRVDLLDRIPLPELQHREVRGIDIAYKDVGTGPALFCLPPWPSSSTAFLPLIQAIKDQVRVIALDLPGWGGYSGQMIYPPTVTEYGRICAEFIKSFVLSSYSLLGYSFGGTLVQQVIATDTAVTPQKVIYVSTLHSGDDLERTHVWELAVIKRVLRTKIPVNQLRGLLARYMTQARLRGKAEFYDSYGASPLYQQILVENSRIDLRSVLRAIYSLTQMELFSREELSPQSLVIYADSDPEYIKKESRELANFLEVTPIYLEHIDHDHFTFDVGKSADVILNFLLA